MASGTRERFAWLDDAACRSWLDWDSWAEPGDLLRVCRDCPVRQPCLESAVALGVGGVRGGTLPSQRRRLRRASSVRVG